MIPTTRRRHRAADHRQLGFAFPVRHRAPTLLAPWAIRRARIARNLVIYAEGSR